jgi:hypothetical protein
MEGVDTTLHSKKLKEGRRQVTEIEEVLDRLEQQKVEAVLPEGVAALQLLQMVYRGQVKLSPQQIRAAVEALPFENPKLSATAVTRMDGKSFHDALERAIERSKQPSPPPLPLDRPLIADHVGPMARLQRRF